MKTIYLFLMIPVVILSACSTNGKDMKKDAAATSSVSLEDTYWKLTELHGEPVTNPPGNQKEAYIQLLKADKRVVGSGGCNSLSGSYELQDGNRLRFVGVASTRMACPDMTIEDGLNRAMTMTDNYVLQGNQLVLHKAKMAPLARFEAVAKN